MFRAPSSIELMSHPASPIIGYCTNVHAGRDYSTALDNIRKHSFAVRKHLTNNQPLGIGLWFSEKAATEAIGLHQLDKLKQELEANHIVPYTMNGFPQGDFHSPVVKHNVYLPTWWHPERLSYTLQLIQILDALLPAGQLGSISTLPISWGSPRPTNEQLTQAARHLLHIANHLKRTEETSGRRIVIAIEPEPGCFITDNASLRQFFSDFLSSPSISEADAQTARTYLTVCHDVCHAAVMAEDQLAEMIAHAQQGIQIGKVQVSSAIQIDWHLLNLEQREQALKQLAGFAEDRYLHQTHVITEENGSVLHEDLPILLRKLPATEELRGQWRIHFHVPIYLDQFGQLGSTRNEINRCLQILHKEPTSGVRFTGHYEVETYAWGVLPEYLRVSDLSEGIANEVQWLSNALQSS